MVWGAVLGKYSEPYSDALSYDEKWVFNTDAVRTIYKKAPVWSRFGAIIVMGAWAPVKVALKPVVDVVCTVIFPLLYFKEPKKEYLISGINAIASLAYLGTYVLLTYYSLGTSYQTTMIVFFAMDLSGRVTGQFMYNMYLAIRGPNHHDHKRGLFSTFFHRFSWSEIRSLASQNEIVEGAVARDFEKISKAVEKAFADQVLDGGAEVART